MKSENYEKNSGKKERLHLQNFVLIGRPNATIYKNSFLLKSDLITGFQNANV